ncbi:MAG TPA: MFS transporter [Burkholderiales bacterium]|jgi:predicted MFS family arabinose efflux permease|nr:MFS transporter [Burkholderiales bacterium]
MATQPRTAAVGAPVETGHTATWALAFGQLVSWGSLYYSFSLLVVPMEQTIGWTRTETNAALSIGLLVSGITAYPIGAWIDRGRGRRVMVAGSALGTAMLLVWSQATSLALVFVAWIGLGVAIAATLYDPVFSVVTHRYPLTFKRRITLITLLGGFASTVFIPLTQYFVDLWGWRGALLGLAAINLLICVPIHLFAIDSSRSPTVRTTARADAAGISRDASRRALRTPAFWGLAVCFTTYFLTFAALTFHLVPLMTGRGVPTDIMLTTMALIGPAQVFARAAWFTVGRNLSTPTVGIIILILYPISIVLLMLAGSAAAMLFTFAICYGAANGMMTILRGTVVQELLWKEGYGTISGLLSLPSNIAKGVAPIAAAGLWQARHNYVAVEWAALAIAVVSAAAFVYAIRASRRSAATIVTSP